MVASDPLLLGELGRFMTPDWAAKPMAVPYADYGDPQSLNLYAYVKNNPLTGIDVTGHDGGGEGTNDPNAAYGQSAAIAANDQGKQSASQGQANASSGGKPATNKNPGTPAPPKPSTDNGKPTGSSGQTAGAPTQNSATVSGTSAAGVIGAPRGNPQFNAQQGAVNQPGAPSPDRPLKPEPGDTPKLVTETPLAVAMRVLAKVLGRTLGDVIIAPKAILERQLQHAKQLQQPPEV